MKPFPYINMSLKNKKWVNEIYFDILNLLNGLLSLYSLHVTFEPIHNQKKIKGHNWKPCLRFLVVFKNTKENSSILLKKMLNLSNEIHPKPTFNTISLKYSQATLSYVFEKSILTTKTWSFLSLWSVLPIVSIPPYP